MGWWSLSTNLHKNSYINEKNWGFLILCKYTFVQIYLNCSRFYSYSQQTFVLKKTSCRGLSSSSSEDVFKTSSSRRIYSPYSYVFRRSLQDVLPRRLQEVLKRFAKCLQDVFKTSSGHFQEVFKTFSGRIIKLNCSC